MNRRIYINSIPEGTDDDNTPYDPEKKGSGSGSGSATEVPAPGENEKSIKWLLPVVIGAIAIFLIYKNF